MEDTTTDTTETTETIAADTETPETVEEQTTEQPAMDATPIEDISTVAADTTTEEMVEPEAVENAPAPSPIIAKQPVDDTETIGNPGHFQLLFKRSSIAGGYMECVRAIDVQGLGCIVMVAKVADDEIHESLVFVPGATIAYDVNGGKKLVLDEHI